MTAHVTVEPTPGTTRVVLRCANCKGGLVIDTATESVVGDSRRWFEREHRECLPAKGSP
jgi:hypothetical protein